MNTTVFLPFFRLRKCPGNGFYMIVNYSFGPLALFRDLFKARKAFVRLANQPQKLIIDFLPAIYLLRRDCSAPKTIAFKTHKEITELAQKQISISIYAVLIVQTANWTYLFGKH